VQKKRHALANNWVKLSEVCEGGGRRPAPPLAFGFLSKHKPLGSAFLCRLFIRYRPNASDRLFGTFNPDGSGIQRRSLIQFFKLCDSRLSKTFFISAGKRLKPAAFL